MTIRRAVPADAATIGELHVRAWQQAYRGLLPDDFLDRLPETLERRIEARRADLWHEPPDQRTWVVVDDASRTVGFAVAGASRDADAAPGTGEVAGIYLAPEVVGTGIGRRLFAHAVDDLRRRGFAEATLWVVDGNARARRFYEAAGWTTDGASKTEERPGAVLREIRYRAVLRPG